MSLPNSRMSGSKLDQIVKGAPPPGTSIPSIVSRSSSPAPPLEHTHAEVVSASAPVVPLGDPLSTLPSSPHQIYLNLLILEASLRSQYLTLRARRRQHTFFLLLLAIWNIGCFYALFLRPREDGIGVGGSVYWVVEVAEKVALMGGIVTGILVWGTGQWERGVRWPRRWVAVANRGLRTMNVKVVIIKGPWWKELLGHLSFLFPFFSNEGSSYHYVSQNTEKRASGLGSSFAQDIEAAYEEDLSPGGDHIKLLLLPKPFSPDFRENWEQYRSDYWEKENERRGELRLAISKRERLIAKEQGGWFWWLGGRGRRRIQEPLGKPSNIEKPQSKHPGEKASRRRPSFARTESHSRTTSRSSTPSSLDPEERPTSHRVRRGSSSNTSSSERRKNAKSSSANENMRVSKLTPLN